MISLFSNLPSPFFLGFLSLQYNYKELDFPTPAKPLCCGLFPFPQGRNHLLGHGLTRSCTGIAAEDPTQVEAALLLKFPSHRLSVKHLPTSTPAGTWRAIKTRAWHDSITILLLTTKEVGWGEPAALEAEGLCCPLSLPPYKTHWHVKFSSVRHDKFFFSVAPLSACLNPATV